MRLCCSCLPPVRLELTSTVFSSLLCNESVNSVCNSQVNYSQTSTCLKALILKLVSFTSLESK